MADQALASEPNAIEVEGWPVKRSNDLTNALLAIVSNPASSLRTTNEPRMPGYCA
jgi:hypothetical protein